MKTAPSIGRICQLSFISNTFRYSLYSIQKASGWTDATSLPRPTTLVGFCNVICGTVGRLRRHTYVHLPYHAMPHTQAHTYSFKINDPPTVVSICWLYEWGAEKLLARLDRALDTHTVPPGRLCCRHNLTACASCMKSGGKSQYRMPKNTMGSPCIEETQSAQYFKSMGNKATCPKGISPGL